MIVDVTQAYILHKKDEGENIFKPSVKPEGSCSPRRGSEIDFYILNHCDSSFFVGKFIAKSTEERILYSNDFQILALKNITWRL